jgi:hypothetical protein
VELKCLKRFLEGVKMYFPLVINASTSGARNVQDFKALFVSGELFN